MKNYINKYSENAKYSRYLADELAWFLSFQLGEMRTLGRSDLFHGVNFLIHIG